MRTNAATWLVTFDGHLARLFRCIPPNDGTHPNSWRLREAGAIANDWQDLKEHARPTMVGGSAGVHHSIAEERGPEEDGRRFARDVAHWLESRCSDRVVERLILCANPRGLGTLRAAFTPALLSRISEVHADLAGLRESDLAEHPTIVAALKEPASPERAM